MARSAQARSTFEFRAIGGFNNADSLGDNLAHGTFVFQEIPDLVISSFGIMVCF
jgi:hypothetical protein